MVIVGVAAARTPETRQRRIVTLREIRVRPRLAVPRELRGAFAAPAITAFVTFALGGLYFALIPTIVIRDLRVTNAAVGGLVVFELGLISAVLVVLGRRLPPVTATTGGLILLLPAVALVMSAQAVGSMPLLLVATALAGVTLALGYRGSRWSTQSLRTTGGAKSCPATTWPASSATPCRSSGSACCRA